jgi:hypothetical protein
MCYDPLISCLGAVLWALLCYLYLGVSHTRISVCRVLPSFSVSISESESESYVTTDGQSASLSWYKAPIWAYDQIFIAVWNTKYVGQLRVCWYGALSLTRGGVCRLQLLLALASAVILGSESPWDSRPSFTVSDLRLLLSVIVGSIVHCHL